MERLLLSIKKGVFGTLNFSDKSDRFEFITYFVFAWIITYLTILLASLKDDFQTSYVYLFLGLITIISISSFANAARRLEDIGTSKLLLIVLLVPIFNLFIIIYLCFALSNDKNFIFRSIYFFESLNIWIGRAFGWCILILTLSVTYEVFVRYVLNAPTVWVFDMMVQMYGGLFLMAGPYALAQDAHVRGDVLYRLFPVRTQAWLDLILYIFFFFPGMLALFWFGYEIASDSWRYKEVSWNSPARIQIYYFKSLIPLAGGLLIIQGISECMRCILCIKNGQWMKRHEDVRETEEDLIKQEQEEQRRKEALGKGN